jgi:hypothetical protein
MSFGFGFGMPRIFSASRAFSPASFFANGEQGWWFDPSNFATLFQDSAGTTPVTAVEQPVGLQLDLSGRGNHRFQPTSANRPVVSARVNLLTKTEQFDDAAWVKSGVNPFGSGSVANATTAPDGTITADFLCEDTTNARHTVYQSISYTLTTPFKYVIYAKQSTRSSILVGVGNSRFTRCVVSLITGTAGAFVGVEAANVTATTRNVGNDWWEIIVSGAFSVADTGFFWAGVSNGTESYAGNGTSGIFIWGADNRPLNQGVGLPVYQRVNTSTDYDSTGFPVYIKPNGSNQFMQTNSINFTATDKMTVWQGLRKIDSGSRFIIELSASVQTNNGTFAIETFVDSKIYATSKGTTLRDVATGVLSTSATVVVTEQADISAPQLLIRANGVQAASTTAGQGTGNYGNYPAYFYARAGSSSFFNGNDYGSIARGAASTAAQITAGETYINSLTKAFA